MFASKRAARDIDSDLDSNSQFWRDAPSVSMASDNLEREVPGYRTEVRSRWTEANLYFLFICPYEQLALSQAQPGGRKRNQ